jgi:hypothetical protein
MPIHVLTKANTNSANSRAVHLNAKICRRVRIHRPLQKRVRIIGGVWIGKAVAQTERDFAIVRVLRERLRVNELPRPDGASFQCQLHALSS